MRRSRRSKLNAAVAVLLVLAVGLTADLAFHGLAWRIFAQLTGEEAPLSQLNGMLGLAGNATRRLPAVASDFVTDPALNPRGVNTFLEDEVEPAKRERQLTMIRDAGFGWIRQQFRWDDLEISARGDFTDRRNAETVSAWAKYDNIVDLAGAAGVQIIARLGSPPEWSQAASNKAPGFAPPADFNDFTNYARQVAERYKGRIHTYQVWNEPNIQPEWGNAPPDPEAYTDLLCRTYKTLKAVDPQLRVVAGALGPTAVLGDYDLSDTLYLQRMYDAGARGCFDVLSIQGYGLRSGPADQRMRAMNININHPLYMREVMVNNGDAAKPVWIAELAWNPVPNDPAIVDRERYGSVTDEQAARYTIDAYERIQREWSWVQVTCYWFFKRASDADRNKPEYYFRMVDPDFTPRPVYDAMKQYAGR